MVANAISCGLIFVSKICYMSNLLYITTLLDLYYLDSLLSSPLLMCFLRYDDCFLPPDSIIPFKFYFFKQTEVLNIVFYIFFKLCLTNINIFLTGIVTIVLTFSFFWLVRFFYLLPS